jgi:hypothetical protein
MSPALHPSWDGLCACRAYPQAWTLVLHLELGWGDKVPPPAQEAARKLRALAAGLPAACRWAATQPPTQPLLAAPAAQRGLLGSQQLQAAGPAGAPRMALQLGMRAEPTGIRASKQQLLSSCRPCTCRVRLSATCLGADDQEEGNQHPPDPQVRTPGPRAALA